MPKKSEYGKKKSTFNVENINSDPTFISPTFKVEEIKVGSEFIFSAFKVDIYSGMYQNPAINWIYDTHFRQKWPFFSFFFFRKVAIKATFLKKKKQKNGHFWLKWVSDIQFIAGFWYIPL